jgi:hypothetical protein
MSDETKISELKQKNDLSGLLEMLEKENDWLLSLDAAEALAQLGDKHGLDRLISALNDSDVDVRDVAREILEGLDDPQGNLALKQIYESQNAFSNVPEIKTESLKSGLINQNLKIIKLLMFLLAIVGVAIANIGNNGVLFEFIQFFFHKFPSNLIDSLFYFYSFPVGLIEIPNLIYLSLPKEHLILVLPPYCIIIATVGWFIYYRIILFGIKIKNQFVFVIVYILFVLLLLGNLSGYTIQTSFFGAFNYY